jgi:hypothetical protein
MQATVFDVRYFEWDNTTDEMWYFKAPEEGEAPQKVQGREFEGQGLKKDQVIAHIRELRSLGYQILNTLVLGNGRSSTLLVTQLCPKLSTMIIQDAISMGFVGQSQNPSLELADGTSLEALELMLNLCSVKDIYGNAFKAHLGRPILEALANAIAGSDPSEEGLFEGDTER